jgi:hypothetical protein
MLNLFSLRDSKKLIGDLQGQLAAAIEAKGSADLALKAEQEANTSALSALKASLEEMCEANENLTVELDAAKAVAIDFEAKVKAAGAHKAQEINASLGVPPVLQAGDSSKAGDKTKTRSEFSLMPPAAQMAFIKSGGQITN